MVTARRTPLFVKGSLRGGKHTGDMRAMAIIVRRHLSLFMSRNIKIRAHSRATLSIIYNCLMTPCAGIDHRNPNALASYSSPMKMISTD